MRLLSLHDTASILHVNITALSELVNHGLIPYTQIYSDNGVTIKFVSDGINQWVTDRPNLAMDDKKYVERLKRRFEEKYPDTIKMLEEFSSHFSDPRVPKGYYLVKVDSKKMGFIYYVRYIKDGKLVPSKWCTHTNDEEAARQFALENRERILSAYYAKKETRKPVGDLYPIFKNYYLENSPYLQIDIKRGRSICEKARQVYHRTIVNKWIPWLRKNKIRSLEEIDTPFMARFQNHLLAVEIKPQTINSYVSFISPIFDHLLLEGYIKANPCTGLVPLKTNDVNFEVRGCYEITKLRGVFNKRWEHELSYLLCLTIYTTGMRNSEIDRIQVKDLIIIDNVHFIDIPKSKTKYGIRIVPLHDFVYEKLSGYIVKTGKQDTDYIFTRSGKSPGHKPYNRANSELAKYTGYSAEQLEKEHITFYSGRHFWKTLMNSEELGDVEEYFMGHTVSGDVAKRYNHRDKHGQANLLKKARKVLDILDKRIFNP